MGRVLPIAAAVARSVGPDVGSECSSHADNAGRKTIRPDLGGEDRDWFYAAGLQICGVKDPGYQVHLYTGVSLTTCRYYFAKNETERRKPSTEFLRVLFQSEHGEPFFKAYLADARPRWFTDLQLAEKRASDAERKLATIRDLTK